MSGGYHIIPAVRRRLFTIAMGIAVIVAVCFMALLPWKYPSSSLLYKFGLDRALLLTGKSAGIAIALLLVIQMVLVARIGWIERRISQNGLITLHRYLGTFIVILTLIHPLLVFAPEDLKSIPVSAEYWPEIVGAVLMLGFLSVAVFSVSRSFAGLPHHLWKTAHRLTAPILMTGLTVHVLFVNDGYVSGSPRYVLLSCAILFGLLWLRIMVRPFMKNPPYKVVSVTPAGRDSVTLTMEPLNNAPLSHAPGQFAYLRIRSEALSGEEHPFTLTSAPDNPDSLSVTIRSTGDWTRNIGQVKSGDTVYVQGPYGLFSPGAYPDWQHLIFIAGGVGITPMLSMLRFFDRTDEQRRVSLLWANQTRAHIVHGDEIADIARRRPNITIHHFFSREPEADTGPGPLTIERIGETIGPFQHGKLVLLCGPEGFMKKRKNELQKLGYPKKALKTEIFHM